MISASLKINVPAAALFALSQDYTQRLQWDSFLKEARVLGGGTPAVGVRTYCRAWNGIGIETEYVSYVPSQVVAVKMISGPKIFSEFAATWRFQQLENQTEVTFIYHCKTNPKFINGLIYFILNFEMRRRLKDLKRFAENSK